MDAKTKGIIDEYYRVLFNPMPGESAPAPRKRPAEVAVEFCTLRMSSDDYGNDMIDVECRFVDGQKYAPIHIDGDCPQLAADIANWINERAKRHA